MEKFTTAKNITELETSEEKELRKTDKKRKQEQGEELIQRLKNNRSTEKTLIRAFLLKINVTIYRYILIKNR